MARLSKTRKAEAERVLTTPPFPSLSAAARTIGLTPQALLDQSVHDPEWYAAIKARRETLRLAWLDEQQADAVAELHKMTADALDVKREHLKHYFAMSVPMVAEKASDYVLDRVVGKATERHEISGKDGGAIKTETKHEFDYDAYRALFSEPEGGDGLPTPAGDGAL